MDTKAKIEQIINDTRSCALVWNYLDRRTLHESTRIRATRSNIHITMSIGQTGVWFSIEPESEELDKAMPLREITFGFRQKARLAKAIRKQVERRRRVCGNILIRRFCAPVGVSEQHDVETSTSEAPLPD